MTELNPFKDNDPAIIQRLVFNLLNKGVNIHQRTYP